MDSYFLDDQVFLPYDEALAISEDAPWREFYAGVIPLPEGVCMTVLDGENKIVGVYLKDIPGKGAFDPDLTLLRTFLCKFLDLPKSLVFVVFAERLSKLFTSEKDIRDIALNYGMIRSFLGGLYGFYRNLAYDEVSGRRLEYLYHLKRNGIDYKDFAAELYKGVVIRDKFTGKPIVDFGSPEGGYDVIIQSVLLAEACRYYALDKPGGFVSKFFFEGEEEDDDDSDEEEDDGDKEAQDGPQSIVPQSRLSYPNMYDLMRDV